jgi:signal peptidase I
MIGSVERYSSSTRRKRAGLLGSRTVRVVIVALVLYIVVSRLLVSTYRIESVSMSPTLRPADRVLVSALSYGARVPFTLARFPGLEKPRRGDIVVLRPPFSADEPALRRILEPFVSFFSLQRATLFREYGGGRADLLMVKRVVGVPGDTVMLRGFVASIRPAGAAEFVPEMDLAPGRYGLRTTFSAKNWKEGLPFSGNSAEVKLKEDEYFVLGDNRPDSSDSRSWGVVRGSRIMAKVILRYWPPSSFGKL